MSGTTIQFNPSGQPFSNDLQPKRMSSLEFLNSIENCYRYKGLRTYGTYYPVRVLPSKWINYDAEWPVVMAAGTIVSIIPIKHASEYSASDAVTGINTGSGGGEVVVAVGQSGTFRSLPLNSVYQNNMSGFIVPATGPGTTAQRANGYVEDAYSDEDGAYGIILPNESVAVSGSTAYHRPLNIPMGIVNHVVYADNAYAYLNYQWKQHGFAVSRDGVLNIPYVSVYGTTAKAAAVATQMDNILAKIGARHQFMYFTADGTTVAAGKLAADANLQPGLYTMPDANGKFVPWASVNASAIGAAATAATQAISATGDIAAGTSIADATYTVDVDVAGDEQDTLTTGALSGATIGDAVAALNSSFENGTVAIVDGDIVFTTSAMGDGVTIAVSDAATFLAALPAGAAIGTATDGTSAMNDFSAAFAADELQKFGQILETRNRLPYGLDEIIDTFPGSEVTGTDTAGLQRRIYEFAKQVMSATNVLGAGETATKEQIAGVVRGDLATDADADIVIRVGTVDIAFGGAA